MRHKNKGDKNTVSILKLVSLYLMTGDNDDYWRRMQEERRKIDQDPRYDIYRHNPRYNDVWTPPNYWETHPDDPRNPYRRNYQQYDEDEYYEDEEEYIEEVDETEEIKDNTPAIVEEKKDEKKSEDTSSSDDAAGAAGGGLCIFCIAVVLIVGIISVAPWLLIIIIPIILCYIFA